MIGNGVRVLLERAIGLDGRALDDPRLSPVHGELAGLPPILLQYGEGERLRDDIRALAARLQAAGVAVTLDGWAGMPHDWQLFRGLCPEAEQATDAGGGWLGERLQG